MLTFSDVVAPLPHFDLRLDCVVDTRRLALFGPSGAGKSSLLELITGMRRPASGKIELSGQTLSNAQFTLELRRRGIGYVPQDAVLFEHLSVEKNIRYSRTVSAEESFEDVAAAMELQPLLSRPPRSLSGGEKRRVAIARALLAEPRLLLLDEPFAGLDHPLRDRVIAALERAALPRILVTHIREEAIALSDYVLMLDRGAVMAYGPTRDLIG